MKPEASRFITSDVFEGMVSFRAIITGIESGTSDRKILRVVYSRERAKKIANHLSYIKAMSYKYGFELSEADDSEIDEVAIGTSHGGIITYCSSRSIPEVSSSDLNKNGFYIMLDGVEDPYNFGYALRSIYASGADGVILPEHNWMSAAGVVCRASAGASEMIKLMTATPEKCIEVFKSNGYKIVCADIENSVSVYDTELKKPLLLAVGGEKRGLSKIFTESADIIVRLDYGREFNSALSAASAASILAFEVLRNNR